MSEFGVRPAARGLRVVLENVRLAGRAVAGNRLRSFLTLLGIVIGVAAVIAMITIGSGTTEKVKTDISKLGSNLLVVRSGRPAQPGAPNSTARALEDKDVTALVQSQLLKFSIPQQEHFRMVQP